MMNDYFSLDEKLQVESFLQVPKAIFKKPYQSLSNTSRLIYSLYLNRYVTTVYKDEDGIPYIIYKDEDVAKKLGCARQAIVRQRHELIELGLVRVKKTISYNRIYVYDYRINSGNVTINERPYYNSEDIKNMQFYKFPHILFESTYKKLSLNEKMLYVYYLDIISLSQAHALADENDRVFFYDVSDKQGEDICLSGKTITRARKKLYAAELLYKVKPYNTATRYYLRKLSQFNEKNLISYNAIKNGAEQKEFIKATLEAIGQNDTISSKEVDKLLQLTHTTIGQSDTINTELVEDVLDIPIRQDETIDVDDLDNLLHFNETKANKQIGQLDTSFPTIDDLALRQNDSYIINTKEKTKKKENKNNSLKLIDREWSECIERFYKYLNQLHSISLDDNELMFAKASIDSLSQMKSFKLKKKNELLELNREMMMNELNKVESSNLFNEIIHYVIQVIYQNGYTFNTVQNQINCFITIMFNYLTDKKIVQETPSWFNAFGLKPKDSTTTVSNAPEEIKNYNWWDINEG